MMLLVTGREKQKEVRIRAEEKRGPSQTQRMSSLALLLKMQHFRGKKKINCNSYLLFLVKLLNHWVFPDGVFLKLPHGT